MLIFLCKATQLARLSNEVGQALYQTRGEERILHALAEVKPVYPNSITSSIASFVLNSYFIIFLRK